MAINLAALTKMFVAGILDSGHYVVCDEGSLYRFLEEECGGGPENISAFLVVEYDMDSETAKYIQEEAVAWFGQYLPAIGE